MALAEVLRGGRVESIHLGTYVVADASGGVLAHGGDTERAIYPRSAIKIMQALPLLLDGAADRFAFSDAELALACASHTGSALHATTALGMLRKAGRDEACLECGTHWPTSASATRALAAAGATPTALHNNCSGKHAGFVCSAVTRGLDPSGYGAGDHPVMRAVTRAMSAVTGLPLPPGEAAIDGCSIPTFPMPMVALAKGFARVASLLGMPQGFSRAVLRLRQAVAAHPLMVAGEGRFDTAIAAGFGEAVFLKSGAEGVCCGAIPGLGLGFALKCDDGSGRGADAAAASLLRGLLGPHPTLDAFANQTLRNWNRADVGAVNGLLG